MVTGAYNPHTFKVGRDGIGKQTNKNDLDFNQGQKWKKKKTRKKRETRTYENRKVLKKKVQINDYSQ